MVKKPIAVRPEGAEALSPGQRPGFGGVSLAPCKGKSFTYRKVFSIFIRCILKPEWVYFKAFALTGRIADCHYTQGDALG